MLVHTSSASGKISNALLMFKSSQNKRDYRNNMNVENYEKWLIKKLIPNLPPNSVLVTDNSCYHKVKINEAPTSNNRKQELLE